MEWRPEAMLIQLGWLISEVYLGYSFFVNYCKKINFVIVIVTNECVKGEIYNSCLNTSFDNELQSS